MELIGVFRLYFYFLSIDFSPNLYSLCFILLAMKVVLLQELVIDQKLWEGMKSYFRDLDYTITFSLLIKCEFVGTLQVKQLSKVMC